MHAKVTGADENAVTIDGIGAVKRTLLGKKIFYSQEEATFHKENLGKNN